MNIFMCNYLVTLWPRMSTTYSWEPSWETWEKLIQVSWLSFFAVEFIFNFSKHRKKTWKHRMNFFWANLWIFILRPSDVRQRIHSYKQGSYKWDLVRFNHTNQKIIMTNIRDDLMYFILVRIVVVLDSNPLEIKH